MTDLITLDSPFPIGKYKGQPIGVVMQDRNYVEWCLSQEGIVQRYAALANLLRGINNPDQDACTPEHNSLQMLFMKPAYQEALARVLAPGAFIYSGTTHAEQLAAEAKRAWPNALEKPDITSAVAAYEKDFPALLRAIQELDNMDEHAVYPSNCDILYHPFSVLSYAWLSDQVAQNGLDIESIAQAAAAHPDIVDDTAEERANFVSATKSVLYKLFSTVKYGPQCSPIWNFVSRYQRSNIWHNNIMSAQSSYTANQAELQKLEANLEEELKALPASCYTQETKTELELDIVFEHNNWDIALPTGGTVKHYCQCGKHLDNSHVGGYWLYSYWVGRNWYIELKPSISEDYPAILRKVKSRIGHLDGARQEVGNKIVITREFTASTATVEEVKAMFRMSGVTLLLLSEIEALIK